MNPFSESHCKDDFKTFSESDKLNSTILKCGNSGSAIIPQGTTNVTVFPIICLTTSRLGNSCIKLNFTSNIVAINLIGTLTFQLYKLCENQLQATTVGPQWIFTRTAGVTDISAFSFSFCDCDICSSKECKYAVVMFPSGGNIGNILVTNATLSAIAVDNSKAKLMRESIHNNELCPVILKCGAPETTLLTGASINAITTTATVASVTLDTSCFCHPCIRFEFASNIMIPTTTANATLTFQIFKNCPNQVQPIPVGTQWTFLTSGATVTSDMFTFFICDCNTCSNECCIYTVQVTATVLARGDVGATTTVTINAATLSAFAVDNVNENC